MRWLRRTLSGLGCRASRARPDRARRRLVIESLEDRYLLATLDLDVQLYSDNGGARGAPIGYARVGETFFLSVTAEDQRLAGTPAGVIALPLDLQWRTDIIRYPGGSPGPPTAPAAIPLPPPTVPNAVVTASFPLQRSVSQFDVGDVLDPQAGKILNLRGASLPELNAFVFFCEYTVSVCHFVPRFTKHRIAIIIVNNSDFYCHFYIFVDIKKSYKCFALDKI